MSGAHCTADVTIGIQFAVIGMSNVVLAYLASFAGTSVVVLGSRIFPCGGIAMAQRFLFRAGGVVATRAGHVGIPSDLGTGRGFCFVAYLVVAEGDDGAFLFLATGRTGTLFLALCLTGSQGDGHPVTIGVGTRSVFFPTGRFAVAGIFARRWCGLLVAGGEDAKTQNECQHD